MVKRSRRRPLTAESGVRFPLGVPKNNKAYFGFIFLLPGVCALHTVAPATNRTVLARLLNASIPLSRYMVFDHIDVPLGSTKKH